MWSASNKLCHVIMYGCMGNAPNLDLNVCRWWIIILYLMCYTEISSICFNIDQCSFGNNMEH